jgi:methionyl-tRNA synthetase
MDELDLQGALEATWGLVAAADQFISANAPWSHAKAGRDAELDGVLASLARTIYRLAVLSTPFIPTKASAIWTGLDQAGTPGPGDWERLGSPPTDGARITRPANLFPKPG